MNIVSAWKDSLTLFIPKNFKLFLLVTLKSIVETYKVWLKYWGWLLVGYAFVFFYGPAPTLANLGESFPSNKILLWAVGLFIYFTLYLSMRPSIRRKDLYYFLSYWWYCVLFVPFFIGCEWLFHVVLAPEYRTVFITPLTTGVPASLFSLVMYSWVLLGLRPLLDLIVSLCVLFLLDSDGALVNAVKSVFRALKMFIYNLPFFVVSFVGFFVLLAIIHLLISFAVIYGYNMARFMPCVELVLLPIPLCYITNFYVKKLHDQFTLYFPQR